MSGPFGRRSMRWLAYLGIFTLLGVFFASQSVMFSVAGERTDMLARRVATHITDWYIYGALTPVILLLARRLPLDWERKRTVAQHVVLAAAFALVKATFCWALEPVFPWLPPDPLGALLLSEFHTNFLYYWIVLGATLALDVYRRYRERALRASQLEARLANAQLDVLRMQLQPHFLFNTLNSIAALMHENVAAADAMISRLSSLLRHAIEQRDTQEAPLRDEVAFVEEYLAIQQARYQERLRIELDFAPESLDALVPTLLLQPLVENAIRHGIDARESGGRIEISAAVSDDRLHLCVRDDGPGLRQDSNASGFGVGLANTRARLQQLYGAAQTLRVSEPEGGGLSVELEVPYRPAGVLVHA